MAITGFWEITSDEENQITLTLKLKHPADNPNVNTPLALCLELNGGWEIDRFQKNMISLQIEEQVKRLILERGLFIKIKYQPMIFAKRIGRNVC